MKRWIGLILIAVLWGYGAILAWTMKDAGNQVFLYCGEGSAVEAEQISQALEREQEQGREMPPEISAWSRGFSSNAPSCFCTSSQTIFTVPAHAPGQNG